MALKQRREIFRGLRNSLEMQQKFPASLSRCTWSQSCKEFLPHHTTVCFAEGMLPAEANADPDTSSLEIASTGTVLHMSAFVPADTGLCLLLWQGELLGTGCKWLCAPAETANLAITALFCSGTGAPHPFQNQCRLESLLCETLLKLMVYCFGFSLHLKCCSWLLPVVVHHYKHHIFNSYHNDFIPHPQFSSLEITYVSVSNTAANTGHSCSCASFLSLPAPIHTTLFPF